ncbi:putative mitochondrial Atp-dependent zinc metallopeptidase [Leptomonas pyrrhocoris]|uniref:Putative mitochondrial Atp-dependent zinc metallopeptidase n=1 Tax=Leptomonas pyrrhocoris TaxID=157538 RepID=A0A0M9FQE3_LEPPY|nr:putative mitochondrial Atp-dependent zinc metallopeptidase [Leptomonas pyrrhocoris]XP_015652316.1 putative mitochondrial Atp-dependent zinc metallopeptidase [Leptomonas pyrrhocoris]KPA73876.1 putative mitochondrial Atp-dependent zinc metallopeptidase [Leptomonas pyrrhocoris]KPA73877.1 putative mitochondrial Atp-dependent zinc metallopeptidase [Leptomonas pyrrhocoris]|eukprot:XP_015652315.1 putative mitochondrial Atp-dependent zinc metallopeptidase [Leptomonas pyrrhocoris]
MLSRRCNARCAQWPARLPASKHTPAILHSSRAMSRFSATSFAQAASTSSSPNASEGPAVAPAATAVLHLPSKSWALRWNATRSLSAEAPRYFASVLQSRYTHVPAEKGVCADVLDASTSSVSRVSNALALLRRVRYLDHLYTRLGIFSHKSAVQLPAGKGATLVSFSHLVRNSRLTNAQQEKDGRLLSRDGGNNKNNNAKKGNRGRNENNNDPVEGGDEDEGKPEDWIVPRTCLFVLIMIAITVALYQLSRPSGKHIGWASLNRHAGEIKEVALYTNYLQVYLDEAKVYLGLINDHDTQRHIDELAAHYRTARATAVQEEQQQQAAALTQKDKKTNKEEDDTSSEPFFRNKHSAADKPEDLDVTMKGSPLAETALVGVGVFAWVVPFVFFPVFVMFLSQYIGKSMSYAVEATKGKTKVKEMVFRVEKSSTTRFRDIAGMKEPKKEITEIVDFLRHPARYTRLGAKIPTGAMLLGPPGTGKTLLAKAVAGESGVAFIPAIGSDFVELYVGMGALRVRQLFKEARKQRCIIYIDEIDAIGLKRQGAGHGEKQEQEQTLNELLTQLDGFSTGKRGDVMVLASSNVPQEALDPALIRPGRFDRIIHVDTPVIAERIDIFKVHLSKLKLVSDDAKKSAEKNAVDTAAAATVVETTATTMEEEKEGKKEEQPSNEAVEATESPASAADAPKSTTGNSLILSQVEAEKQAFETEYKDGVSERGDGSSAIDRNDAHDFDFRALLMQKSDAERAMIDVYAERMSNLCPGFVGADIANVCNEGAILAAREGADHVDISHLERSIDRVLAGIEHRSRAMSDFEKNVVAHHEAGHAVAGWFLNRADPLMKVSIVPRGGSALGYAQYLPNENFTRTAKEIRDSISVTLGGRVAEQIFFRHLSTGASDDLRKVGRMAYQYVSSFSPGSVYPAPGTNSTRLVKPFGVNKSNDFDRRAKSLVDEVYADTLALLTEHKEDMKKLADHLLKHELLTYSDVVRYLGARGTRQTDKKKGV